MKIPSALEVSLVTNIVLLVMLMLRWVGHRVDQKYARFLLTWVKPTKGLHSRMNKWLHKELKRAVDRI